MACAFKPGVGK